MQELLERLLPILFLILIGVVIKKTKLLSEEVMVGLKTIIIKVALPIVLFKSFSMMDLELSYLLLFILVFVYCVLLYGIGEWLHKKLPKVFNKGFTGGYFTGFEFGMIGVGLFGAIWGVDKLPVIMLVGFGHELFIWFLYVPLITMKDEHDFSIVDTLKAFVKTPTILGIILGVLVNVLNLYNVFGETLLGSSVYATIDFLTPLTSPLILIVIGYAMSFKMLNLKETLSYILTRWVFVLSIGSLLLLAILKIIPDLDPLFVQAFYAFILLPAPYILPLFVKDKQEAEFFSQLLVYSTLTTFVGYIVLLWFSL